jgi:hypothetical protein
MLDQLHSVVDLAFEGEVPTKKVINRNEKDRINHHC